MPRMGKSTETEHRAMMARHGAGVVLGEGGAEAERQGLLWGLMEVL